MYYSEVKIENKKKKQKTEKVGKIIDGNEIAREEIEFREREKNFVENSIKD